MKRVIAASLDGILLAAGVATPGPAQAATAPSEVEVVPAPTYPA